MTGALRLYGRVMTLLPPGKRSLIDLPRRYAACRALLYYAEPYYIMPPTEPSYITRHAEPSCITPNAEPFCFTPPAEPSSVAHGPSFSPI